MSERADQHERPAGSGFTLRAVLLMGLVDSTTATKKNPRAALTLRMAWHEIVAGFPSRDGAAGAEGDSIRQCFSR